MLRWVLDNGRREIWSCQANKSRREQSSILGDAIKNSKLMKDALETTHEITKLIKKSPKGMQCYNR